MRKTVKIKGMVCNRCIDTVQEIFESQGFLVDEIKLGEVVLTEDASSEKESKVKELLSNEGFEVLDDKNSTIIDKVKTVVAEILNNPRKHQKQFAEEISSHLNMDYGSISVLFSQTEGTTIEQYVIQTRIEKVKEMLVTSQKSLTDIAFETGFSSVHHLSNQFKKITGMPPSVYKKLKTNQEFI